MVAKPFTVELKETLLEYLLELKEDWDDDNPDIRVFWHTVERDFREAKNTTWAGKDFEEKMEREEEAWLEECEDPNKKRRRGHEAGSNYDVLMKKWCTIWNRMLEKHWQFMVDTREETWDNVPNEFKKDIRRPPPLAEEQAPPQPAVTAPIHYEYDGAKLERVVQAAAERARDAGKHDLAAAVEQVYHDALEETNLRILLEAILTQKADRRQNEEFQQYVKLAKAKIKAAKEEKQRQDEAAAAARAARVDAARNPTPTAAPAQPAVTAPVAAPHVVDVDAPPANVTANITPAVAAPAPVAVPVPAVVPVAQAAAPVVQATAPIAQAAPAPVIQATTTTSVQTPVQTPVQNAAQVAVQTPAQAPIPTAPAEVAVTPASAMPPPAQPSTASQSSKGKGKAPAAKTKAPAKSKVTPSKAKKQSPAVQGQSKSNNDASASKNNDNAPVNPNIDAILGNLQHMPSAQMILAASPDIADSRLELLKQTMLKHPETKDDVKALGRRLLEIENSAASAPQPQVTAQPQATVGASRPARANAGKRRRASDGEPSMAEAEEDDRLEAQRAAKRRRGETGEDDGGDYHPLKAVRDKAAGGRSRKKQKKTSSPKARRPGTSQSVTTSSASSESFSRGSSPLSELDDDVDMESTKSAYVDEMLKRQTDQEARRVIEQQYGPVSPTLNGDAEADRADREHQVEEWASMPSPTLGAAHVDDDMDTQFEDNGANTQLEQRVPSPPPEPAPENNDALEMIAGAAAQALARDPGIGRLEAKLDTLMSQNPAAANGQTAAEMNMEGLKELASALRNAEITATAGPGVTQMALKLALNSAEGAIHAAEAAKKSSEIARDVILMVRELLPKGAADNPATPVSEN